MKKAEKQQIFIETYVLNNLIECLGHLLKNENGYNVQVFENNEDWLVKGLVTKELDCIVNGVSIKITASYAYAQGLRGCLMMHYTNYLDKWNREIVVRKQVSHMDSETLFEEIKSFVLEMTTRCKEYKRQPFVIIDEVY